MKPYLPLSSMTNLENFPKQELDWIEYKGRRALDLSLDGVSESTVRISLSKAISAFANSGGGLLVFGINNATFNIDDGGINRYIKPSGTKSWLEDIISSIVDPPLNKFNVVEVLHNQLSEIVDESRAIFIIEVPDSTKAPHQALDNKYYGRIGGKSKPLSNRFILDILGRRTDPVITPQFSLVIEKGTLFLYILLENNGKVMGRYVSGWVNIPKFLIPGQFHDSGIIHTINNIEYFQRSIDNTKKDFIWVDHVTNKKFFITRYVPILRGSCFFIIQKLNKNPFKQGVVGLSGEKILWELAVDNAPMKSGEFLFSELFKQSKKYNQFDL